MTVLRRTDTAEVDFTSKLWNDYKNGFGNLSGEFWIGNENLHLLTSYYNTKVKFELEAANKPIYLITYSEFRVAAESSNYRLSISGYSGRMYILCFCFIFMFYNK